jgi:hypothetical protein
MTSYFILGHLIREKIFKLNFYNLICLSYQGYFKAYLTVAQINEGT